MFLSEKVSCEFYSSFKMTYMYAKLRYRIRYSFNLQEINTISNKSWLYFPLHCSNSVVFTKNNIDHITKPHFHYRLCSMYLQKALESKLFFHLTITCNRVSIHVLIFFL